MMDRSAQQKNGPLQGTQESYDPELLLDSLLGRMRLKEDAELARLLKIEKRLLGKIRDRRLQISGSMLLLIQEATGISVGELRSILRDRRRKSRMTGVPGPFLLRK
ncbi:MAG TPA: hypothetical protein VF797_01975 [Noviherbaspirillum sp.]